MDDRDRMKCPDCGAEMNHHADKLVYGAESDAEAEAVVVEAHACPGCGRSATRPAPVSP
jgi:ribosomal protein S27AE